MIRIRHAVLLGLVCLAGCSHSGDVQERGRFEALAHQYADGAFAFRPSAATYEGDHRFDDSLEDWTPEAVTGEEARIRKGLDELDGIDPARLDTATRIDYELLQSRMQADLFNWTEIRPFETDPGQYNYGFMLESMIARDFAPPETRLRLLTTRLRQVGRQLENARANLKNPPAMFTSLAAEYFEGTIDYLQHDVPLAFASVRDSALLADFHSAQDEVVRETKDHITWLRKTLLPTSHGDYILGEAKYAKKLRYEEMIDLPIDTLLAVGERELARLTARYQAAAHKIDASVPVDTIVARMRKDHPPADSLLAYANGLLEGARSFCISSRFIAIPSEVRCKVRPTPSFEASRSFASFDGPGALETKATEAYYNITLPDKSWPKAQVEQHLQGFSRWTLPSVSIHEVYPGHYVHFLYMKRAPSYVRKIAGCGSMAEGWGLYTEEGLLDQGYAKGDPRIEFGVMRWALTRACRLQVGIRMHTRGMTMEQGVQYFMDHAGLERANAEREAGRAAFDPTYSVYTLGAMEIRKLRDDLAREQGKSFDLADFHAEILSQGALPVALLRRMLLKDEGRIL